MFVVLLLHLDTSIGWPALSCGEVLVFSAGVELDTSVLLLSFLMWSVLEAGCRATGGAGRPPPLSWELLSSCSSLTQASCGLCASVYFGEEAFREPSDCGAAECKEVVVCLAGALWMSTSEKRTFFSCPRGDEVNAFLWVSSFKLSESQTSSSPLEGSDFTSKFWSFRFLSLASVRVSSSSRNSSSVVSLVWKMK